VVGLTFAAISYGIAAGEANSRFGLREALKLNLVQFYLWGIFSLFVFSASTLREQPSSPRQRSLLAPLHQSREPLIQ